jgi:hypothetical protein
MSPKPRRGGSRAVSFTGPAGQDHRSGSRVPRAAGTQRNATNRSSITSWIIPGNWGKVGPGWLARLLWQHGPQGPGRGRQNSPVPLAAVARRQSRDTGTARQGAIRSCLQPSQVARAGFGFGRIAVTPEGNRLLLRASTVRAALRPPRKGDPPNQRRRKAGQRERMHREVT